MIIIKDTTQFHLEGRTVVTLGKFDGVHRGHQALIKRTVEAAGREKTPVVFAFDISPTRLLTKKERRMILSEMGVGIVIECPFVPEIITMAPEEFMQKILKDSLHADRLVVGPNFRFGYEREGNAALLLEKGEDYGFTTEVVPDVMEGGSEISSTRIRTALAEGKMAEVNRLLGYPFFITGEIIHGRHIGRTLGVPTTNIIPGKNKLLPPNGVYASLTKIGERTYRGVTDIGTKPTVDGQFIGVETFLFDCSENLYGEDEKVCLLDFERPEMKFPSIDALKEQLRKDEENGRRFFLTYKE